MPSDIARRLRGAAGNALFWGACWWAVAFGVSAVRIVTGNAPATASLLGAARGAMMFAVMGTLAGAAFSTFFGLWYRGHRLSRIGWIRFAIVGGIVTGLFVPGFISLMRFLSGEAPLAVASLLRNGLVGLVFGSAAAGGSMKLAQLASGRVSDGGHDDINLIEE